VGDIGGTFFCFGLRVEFLLKTESGYLRDAEMLKKKPSQAGGRTDISGLCACVCVPVKGGMCVCHCVCMCGYVCVWDDCGKRVESYGWRNLQVDQISEGR